jgi:hypothetical protein
VYSTGDYHKDLLGESVMTRGQSGIGAHRDTDTPDVSQTLLRWVCVREEWQKCHKTDAVVCLLPGFEAASAAADEQAANQSIRHFQ